MKILLLTLDDYPHHGGKSTHIASLIDGLKKEKVDCYVISRSDIPRWKMNFHKLWTYPLRFINITKYLYLRKKNEFVLFQKLVQKHLKTNHYEYVSCQDALACTAYGRLHQNSNITLTMHTYFGLEYTLDNSYFTEENKEYQKLLSLEEESLQYVHNIVAVDDRIEKSMNETIQTKCKERKNEIRVTSIVNFTNTDIYNTNKEEHEHFNIICVRRLVEKNGVYYGVEAMKYLKDKDIQLHIYGSGPEEEHLQRCILDHQLTNVFLHGSIDNQELPKIYQKMDLVLVPSITVNGLQEATSISAIEAMSCGLPVIASSIGGLKQMIDGKNGILVDEQDSKAIADAIIEIYSDSKKQQEISKQARQYVLKNHSHITAAKQYLMIFKS